MRICYIADYRSPTARSWIHLVASRGHEVHVISTHPVAAAGNGIAGLVCIPIGLAALAARRSSIGPARRAAAAVSPRDSTKSTWLAASTTYLSGMIRGAYEWVAPLELLRHVARVREAIAEVRPDMVHAMRIPFEGILAARALEESSLPLIISVWGNDFTLHAAQFATVGIATRRALARCHALHSDCERDIRLARGWNFDPTKPSLVVPGSGGVHGSVFYNGPVDLEVRKSWNVPPDALVVLNPRRFRPGSVRTDVFFKSIPLVLERAPGAVFVAVGMQGHPTAEHWVRKYGIENAVRLLPEVDHHRMGDVFRSANVVVSPSNHDGTPNTLLEAMACGACPVAGDIESVREWINSGTNGLLCDPNSEESLADAIVETLSDADLRERARSHNAQLIAERADSEISAHKIEEFYNRAVYR